MNTLILTLFLMVVTAVDGSSKMNIEDGATTKSISNSIRANLELETRNNTQDIHLFINHHRNSRNVSRRLHNGDQLMIRGKGGILDNIIGWFNPTQKVIETVTNYIKYFLLDVVPILIRKLYEYSTSVKVVTRLIVYVVLFLVGALGAPSATLFAHILRPLVAPYAEGYLRKYVTAKLLEDLFKQAIDIFDNRVGIDKIIKIVFNWLLSLRPSS